MTANKDALHNFNYADANNLRMDDLGERTKTTIRTALQTQAELVELLKSGNHTYLGGEYVVCLKPDEVKKALARAEGRE